MVEETKRCTKCKVTRVLHKDFYSDRGWYRNVCKQCFKKEILDNKKQREETKKKLEGDNYGPYITKYSIENREKILQYRQNFKERHPSYGRDYQRKRAALNKAKKAEC